MNGIPTELHKIDCTEHSKDDEIDPDRGPLDEIPFNEDTELSSTILNPVQLKPQKQLITGFYLQVCKSPSVCLLGIQYDSKTQTP